MPSDKARCGCLHLEVYVLESNPTLRVLCLMLFAFQKPNVLILDCSKSLKYYTQPDHIYYIPAQYAKLLFRRATEVDRFCIPQPKLRVSGMKVLLGSLLCFPGSFVIFRYLYNTKDKCSSVQETNVNVFSPVYAFTIAPIQTFLSFLLQSNLVAIGARGFCSSVISMLHLRVADTKNLLLSPTYATAGKF